jgi:predicted MPP superfamily phosphohydrolase
LAAAVVVGVAVWALVIEPRRLVTRGRTLGLAGWPRELDGLRVVVVSDLHAGSPQIRPPQLRRIARAVARAPRDLVLFLGDFVDDEVALGDDVPPEAVGAALAPIDAACGVFGLLGNHDWRYDGERVERAMQNAGITMLENESVRLERAGCAFWLVVVGDRASRRDDIQRAVEGVPAGEPVIVATHSPDLFPELPQHVALTLAGHTHGGQVNIPGLRGAWTPSRFGGRYASGSVRDGAKTLYVHPGVGTSKLAVRLGAPPEVSVLTLRGRRGRRSAG